MDIVGYLARRSASFHLALGLALVALLGIVDYLTGPDLSFLIFYLIPVFLVSWFAGRRSGFLISAASTLPWFVDDVLPERSRLYASIPYWNVTTKLGVFLVFAQAVSALKSALEREKTAEEERLRRDIEIAKEVQARLFPQSPPPMKTMDYAGICVPARGVGGDYYDFLPLGPDRLGIALGDISGKGISAALLMASLQGLLRSRAPLRGDRVETLLGDLNRLLWNSTDSNKYATFFYAFYDDGKRLLTYVNAGHNPPILCRPAPPPDRPLSPSGPDGMPAPSVVPPGTAAPAVLRLEPSGFPIGLFPDSSYRQTSIPLAPGDVLIIFSDGISEAADVRGREFGVERLFGLVCANIHLPAAALRDRILSGVADFVGQAPQQDDETLVVAKAL